MNPAFFVLAVLFAIAGHQEARRFARQYGDTPWRWDPWGWAVVMFLSWVIGIVLLAIAERQGRSRAARQPAYASGYVQPAYAQQGYQQGYGQPAVAAAPMRSRFGINEPATTAAFAGTPAPGPAPVAAPTAALPAAMWAADPTGRHQYRWWDGSVWTPNVSSNGVVAQDPV